jgi:DnaJ-class molecular chaperone
MEPVNIKTLDNRSRLICFDELVSPQTLRHIAGEGMPKTTQEEIEKNPAIKLMSLYELPKGDLYVRFDIEIPTNLTLA